MSRGAHSFKQGDLAKVVKVLLKAGASGWRIEIVHGKIVVIGAAAASAPDTETSADIRKLL
jgi:hypothetical protein